MINFKSATQTIKILSVIFVCGLHCDAFANAYTLEGESGSEWEICAMCHGVDGISRTAKFPKLAHQKPAYLYKQFTDFRNGHRTNDGGQMSSISTEVEEASIKQIISYFASLPAPNADTELVDTVEIARYKKGKILYKKYCMSCHDNANSEAPWLYAQHADYLAKQIDDFNQSKRVAPPNLTHKFSAKLDKKSTIAVSFYLSKTAISSVLNEH